MARVGGVAPPLLVAQRTPERAGDFRVPSFGASALAPSPFLAAAARLAPQSGEAVSTPTVAAAPPRSVRRDLLQDFECHVHEPRWTMATEARRPPARPPAQRLRATLACARPERSAPPQAYW